MFVFFVFFKQKTAYEMRISDWSSDVCSSDLTMQRKLSAGVSTLRRMGDTHYGATPKHAVWSDGKVTLYRYQGEHAATARVPILICYALVNRPYMVDLQHDRSLVKGLLARGEDVYILDWGYPDLSDRFLTLEDYLLDRKSVVQGKRVSVRVELG